MMATPAILGLACLLAGSAAAGIPIVDTGQTACYDELGEISCPMAGQTYHGQDAQHDGPHPAYQSNGDGTITDLNTGLMWVAARGSKMSWDDAMAGAATCTVGGYTDWRAPTIKELYSLIDFSGYCGTSAAASSPFLESSFFEFAYGNELAGERFIDCQDWSVTEYVSTTMNGDATVFGVNFADGRIKGYPKFDPMAGGDKELYIRYVRGETGYGENDFVENGDSTVTDLSTGLMWAQHDSQVGMDWVSALAWVESKNATQHLGYDDWRLANAKEMQSLVDYTRSPATSGTPAIDPVFQTTQLGDGEYPFFWTSTTHRDGPADRHYRNAVYIAFGRATGWMEQPPGSGNLVLLDVHGAGAQRSDPKSGDPDDYPYGFGPQGDVIRIENFVRLVRDVDESTSVPGIGLSPGTLEVWPNPSAGSLTIRYGLERGTNAELSVFAVNGRHVVTLAQGELEQGLQTVTWPGHDEEGRPVPPGIYLVRLRMPHTLLTERITLIR
jgi:hypothetical protein